MNKYTVVVTTELRDSYSGFEGSWILKETEDITTARRTCDKLRDLYSEEKEDD